MGVRVSRREFRRDARHAGGSCEWLQSFLALVSKPCVLSSRFPMSRAVLLALFALAASTVGAAQQTFRTAIDLVHFGVVVTDKQGTPITGLTADDFEIKEAGKPQTIKFFAAGDPAAAPPLHLGFLLDASGSMEEDMKDVRTAAIKFLNTMDQAEDITLVDFDTEVRMARYSGS